MIFKGFFAYLNDLSHHVLAYVAKEGRFYPRNATKVTSFSTIAFGNRRNSLSDAANHTEWTSFTRRDSVFHRHSKFPPCLIFHRWIHSTFVSSPVIDTLAPIQTYFARRPLIEILICLDMIPDESQHWNINIKGHPVFRRTFFLLEKIFSFFFSPKESIGLNIVCFQGEGRGRNNEVW